MAHTSGLNFRTAGSWGPGLGRNLTPAEVDGNFDDLDERVDDLETNPPVAVSISAISVVGNSMTVFLDDSTELGPFTLPTAEFNWRGNWAAGTSYFEMDVFYAAGDGVYLVNLDFESASAFDPGGVEISLMLPDRADWHWGSGAPDAGLGGEGDLYLDTASGDVYGHDGSAGWSVIDNLTGPTGATGADGADGAEGTTITSLDDVPDVEYGTAGPAEGDGLVRRSGAWVPEARVYDFGFAFGAAPDNFSVIGRVAIPRNITIPADFSGSFGDVETNPDGQFDIDVQDDGATIGTISVSAAGAFTFTTTGGTAKSVAAGSVIRAVSPDGASSPETTIAGLAIGIVATLD